MIIVTAPEPTPELKPEDDQLPKIFLAGGITDCPNWQKTVIDRLSSYDNGVLFNPRRDSFPINDPSASIKQIEWEFAALNECTIFSMWFTAGPSVQPICLYELGRHLALKRYKFHNLKDRVLIGIEPGYVREQDVRIQVGFVDQIVANNIANSLDKHIENIIRASSRF